VRTGNATRNVHGDDDSHCPTDRNGIPVITTSSKAGGKTNVGDNAVAEQN
jgi:hypothetical protein